MQNKNFNSLLKETFVFRPSGKPQGTVISTFHPSGYQHQGQGMLRYADGQWIPDDGEMDLAFVEGVFAYGVDLPHHSNILWTWRDVELEQKWLPKHLHEQARGWHYFTIGNSVIDDDAYDWEDFNSGRKNHPNEIAHRSAMDKCCSINSCANGRSVSLTSNPYHEDYKADLYIKGSMAKVLPPANPVCYLCLNNGKGHLISALNSYKDQLESDIEYFKEAQSKAELEVYDAQSNTGKAEADLVEVKEEISKIIK